MPPLGTSLSQFYPPRVSFTVSQFRCRKASPPKFRGHFSSSGIWIACSVYWLDYGPGGTRNSGSIPSRGEKHFSCPGLPTPSGAHPLLFSGYRGFYPRKAKLTGHFRIAQRFRMSGTVRPHTYRSSWLVQGKFSFTLVVFVMRVNVYL